MPSTIETAAQRIAVALQALPGSNGVERDREAALTREDCPLYLVERVDGTARSFGGGGLRGEMDDWEFRVAVSAVVRGPNPQALADLLMTQAHRTLTADFALQSLVSGFRADRREWLNADTDQACCFDTVIYRMRRATAAGEL